MQRSQSGSYQVTYDVANEFGTTAILKAGQYHPYSRAATVGFDAINYGIDRRTNP